MTPTANDIIDVRSLIRKSSGRARKKEMSDRRMTVALFRTSGEGVDLVTLEVNGYDVRLAETYRPAWTNIYMEGVYS